MSAVLPALAAPPRGGGAAHAPDELVGPAPPAGATAGALPPRIALTYSSVPSGIGAEVQVLDEAGTDWADGAVGITDRTATQTLRTGGPAGEATVNGGGGPADSPPTGGPFTFTARRGTSAVPDSVTTSGPIDAEEPAAGQEPVAGVSDFPWSIVLMIGVLVVIVAALGVTARKRLGSRD
ncbi:hypothetical protein AC792_06780 [Arthrobacter sp. RIT-PI-e]|nr:hypothetical protein AC792_06780 [Arthrobacter sp. RIT-PI-e]